MRSSVPVLITLDIDPTLEKTIEDKRSAVRKAIALFEELGIVSTFYVVANLSRDYEEEVRLLVSAGHEIGCHGLTHGDQEEYDRAARTTQVDMLRRATDVLSDVSARQIRSFRGPRMKTSHVTQGILEELGYRSDCSVNSQRVDFISSNLVNFGWVFAPRVPYHPSERSAYRRGGRRIWVIPASAVILPFMANTGYVLGVTFMKVFCRALYVEASRTRKPIVYSLHPSDFAPATLKYKRALPWHLKIRTHGLLLRAKLYQKDPAKRFEMNRRLLLYMKSLPGAEFMSASRLVATLDQGATSGPPVG